MAQSEKQPAATITVTCPTCHERLRVTLEELPQRVECLFCRAPVNVPAAADAKNSASDVKPTRRPEEIGEYAISDAPRGAEAHLPGAGAKQRALPAKLKETPATVRVECTFCHTPVEAVPQVRSQTIMCPECTAPVRIPSKVDAEKWRTKQIAPRPKEEIGEFTALPPSIGPKPSLRLFDALGAIREEAEPPPPDWTFFSGVFSFPWREDARIRWGYMSFGLLVLSLFAVMGRLALRGVTGGAIPLGGGVTLAFFALPMIWIFFWSASYSAACFLCVVEETASGNDRITEWPEPHWKEWFARLLYILCVAVVPLVLSYGAGKLSEMLEGPFWPVMAACGLALLPINLLSALDAGSPMVPFTMPILTSLFRLWWGWLTVLLLSTLLWGAWIASVIGGLLLNEFVTVLWTGPLLAAVLLIEARLLGRLVWRASTLPKRRRRAAKDE